MLSTWPAASGAGSFSLHGVTVKEEVTSSANVRSIAGKNPGTRCDTCPVWAEW